MSFADATVRTIREAIGGDVRITLAGTVACGDPIGYNSGWVQADANPFYRAYFIAGEAGVSGQVITCYRGAVVSGFTDGTAGNALYLSDTAGTYSDSAGTYTQVVGRMLSATEAIIEPTMGAATETGDVTTGFIPLDISTAREIASNDIQNLAAHGGIMASDSVPDLARDNGATDKALRLTWAGTEVDEVQFGPVAKPPDLDATQNVTVHLMGKMAGSTDTPTVDIQFWDGVGDTECGGASTAFGSTLAEETVTILATNISAAPGFFNVGLVPGAHGTDALYIYAAWIEYTRTIA